MKQKNLFISIIALMAVLSSCKKENVECDLMPAEIIRYDCDRVIFRLLTSTPIGDPDWTDVQTGQHYSNVVSYYNTCRIAQITNGEKSTLYVNLLEPDNCPVIEDCVQCQAVSEAPPQTAVAFGNISKLACDDLP